MWFCLFHEHWKPFLVVLIPVSLWNMGRFSEMYNKYPSIDLNNRKFFLCLIVISLLQQMYSVSWEDAVITTLRIMCQEYNMAGF
jgi:hypothetical protein